MRSIHSSGAEFFSLAGCTDLASIGLLLTACLRLDGARIGLLTMQGHIQQAKIVHSSASNTKLMEYFK